MSYDGGVQRRSTNALPTMDHPRSAARPVRLALAWLALCALATACGDGDGAAGSDAAVADGGSGARDAAAVDARAGDGGVNAEGDCTAPITFEMVPSDATLSGAWRLDISGSGEGEIVRIDLAMGIEGSILFEPTIPCRDTWYIWVRAFDTGTDDSYFATIDGVPTPPALFEADCTGDGAGYLWVALNWRDSMGAPCTYVEDPWAPSWAPGAHTIEFQFRESQAMGRILLTNDASYLPD
jgi:hypothetical protein